MQHLTQLGVGPAVQAKFRQTFHRHIFVFLFRLRNLDNVFFENPDPFEFGQNFINGPWTVCRLLFQQPENDSVHFRSDVIVELRCIRGFVTQMSLQQFFWRRSLEGGATGKHFEEHDPQAVQVCLKGRGLLSNRFRGDVCSSSLDRLQFPPADHLRETGHFLAGE